MADWLSIRVQHPKLGNHIDAIVNGEKGSAIAKPRYVVDPEPSGNHTGSKAFAHVTSTP